jgi:hypothetical protein
MVAARQNRPILPIIRKRRSARKASFRGAAES